MYGKTAWKTLGKNCPCAVANTYCQKNSKMLLDARSIPRSNSTNDVVVQCDLYCTNACVNARPPTLTLTFLFEKLSNYDRGNTLELTN